MIRVYKQSNSGVKITDPITKEEIMYWILSYVDDNTIVKSFNNNQPIEEILQSMKESLLEWNELLKLTGGALSLPKCKVSVLQWKGNYWGIQKPVTKSNGKTITVPSEELGASTKPLERLRPQSAERVLGLRLPMLGTMDSELKFRKQQIEKTSVQAISGPNQS